METNRLNQFYTLYQIGNLRKAAEIIGISHSGLSKSMGILEREVAQKLFIQSGRGIIFTDEGATLAKKIPEFIKKLEDLTLISKAKTKEIIRIGSFEVFTTYFSNIMGPLFHEYDLDFHELIPGKIEKALLNHEIDMAITYEPIAIPGVEHLKVSEIEMGAFTKKGAFKNVNTLEIPFAAPLIPMSGSPTGLKGLDGWPDNVVKRDVRYRVDLMETAISLARNGHCCVFIPTFIAKLHNEIVKPSYQLAKRSLPKSMKTVRRNVYIVKRESTIEDTKIKKLAKYLRKL